MDALSEDSSQVVVFDGWHRLPWCQWSLTSLSLHQTRIQRSTVLLEGAGPLSQGRAPTAPWPGRDGPRRRRHRCCPVRSLRRRNTSTYRCCWRRRASAPPMTPSTKVTEQILQPLPAPLHKRVPEPRHSLCPCLRLDTEATFRLLFSATHHYLSRCWLLCKVAFFLNELTNFYGVFFILLPGLKRIFV